MFSNSMFFSAALEPGGSPLLEGEQAFLEVRTARRELQRERLALHRPSEPRLERAMDALLGEPDRDGGTAGEPLDQRRGGRPELVVGRCAGDDSPGRGFSPGELPAEEEELLGSGDA